MEELKVIMAIHHPTRRRIVDHLVLHEPDQVGAVARALGLQVGSVSHHLKVLQRAGAVEPVPDPDGDGRASWWRMSRTDFSWAAEDFTSPADHLRAREAEQVNLANQLRKLQQWQQRKRSDSSEWPKVAFSTDSLAWATPEEVRELSALLGTTLQTWRESIDTSDGQERRPVFIFAHGFPTEP